MKPTEQLKEEHEEIGLMLRVLTEISRRLKAAEKVDPRDIEQAVEFIKVFADKCHHGKEEDVLFPEMEKTGISRRAGPIGVMLSEHNAGRDFVRGMSEAAGAYGAGDTAAAGKFADNALGYAGLLARHIYKENNVLYPMADARIPADVQDRMLDRFKEIELAIGEGAHERLHEGLHRLAAGYLK